jgi:hypothetical protein
MEVGTGISRNQGMASDQGPEPTGIAARQSHRLMPNGVPLVIENWELERSDLLFLFLRAEVAGVGVGADLLTTEDRHQEVRTIEVGEVG